MNNEDVCQHSGKKTLGSFWNIWESHINLYNRKESVLCIEVTKTGEKLLVLLILQGYQASVWVFILVHCMVTFSPRLLAKFEFPARRSNKTCPNTLDVSAIMDQSACCYA